MRPLLASIIAACAAVATWWAAAPARGWYVAPSMSPVRHVAGRTIYTAVPLTPRQVAQTAAAQTTLSIFAWLFAAVALVSFTIAGWKLMRYGWRASMPSAATRRRLDLAYDQRRQRIRELRLELQLLERVEPDEYVA